MGPSHFRSRDYPAKRYWRAVLDPRRHVVAKLVALAGLAYLFIPIDLIPDRLPLVGHLDEIGFVGFGLVGAHWLAATDRPARMQRDGRSRRAARACVGMFCAYPALRVTLGRWPDRVEARRFRRAFMGRGAVPPLLRAVANVPAARPLLTRTMLASWMEADPAGRAGLRAGLDGAQVGPGNMFGIWTGPRIGFLHLEKTAGSALGAALQECFHPLQICPLRPTETLAAGELPTPDVRRWSLIWGHYDLPALEQLDPDRFLIAFFRDPRARLISLYRFWRHASAGEIRRTERSAGVSLARTLSFRDFLRSDHPAVIDAVDNYYVRRLTGLYREDHAADPLDADPGAALAAAEAALARLDFVGVTEQLDEGARILARILDFTPPLPLARVNASRGAHDIAGDAAAEITRCTRMDRVIYDAALARFRQAAGSCVPRG